MTVYNFQKVSIRRSKSDKCACGKRRTRSKEFWQTINPFNLKNGRQKTYDEIKEELKEEAAAWGKKPIICAQCPEEKGLV